MPQADQSPQHVEDPKDPKPMEYAASSSQPDSAALQESGQVSSEPQAVAGRSHLLVTNYTFA